MTKKLKGMVKLHLHFKFKNHDIVWFVSLTNECEISRQVTKDRCRPCLKYDKRISSICISISLFLHVYTVEPFLGLLKSICFFPGLTLFNSLKTICTSLVENEEKLNDLDRAAGDGDTGTTVARGANCTFLFPSIVCS